MTGGDRGGEDGPRGSSTSVPGPDRGSAVRRVTGTGVPLRGDDIDTDQILPARFLKEVTFDRMGEYAFHDARRHDDGTLNAHPFNEYRGASILVVNDNFGCGSSREHAPQGLLRWGVRGIVGESFAEIFADNCRTIGVPCATAPAGEVDRLQSFIEENPEAGIELDVARQRVVYDGREVGVTVDDSMREALVAGEWDTTSLMRANLEETRQTAADLPYVSDITDE